MTGDRPDAEDLTAEELRTELRQTRSRLRAVESELSDTNEGMLALTLELENAKDRYQTIFEESSNGILLIDTELDTIQEANPQACELLGYDRETLLTLSPEDLFPVRGDESPSFAEVVVDGWADDFTCRTNDGRRIDLEISASKITLDGKSLLLASMRDITERKRREQRLQVLSRILRHNLRNDGNVIQGHADLLCEELSDPDLQASGVQIQETIDKILRLSSKARRVQDVLDRERITPTPVDGLVTHSREWVEEMYPAASVIVDLPAQDTFVGRRLGIAIQEAIENAVIHTEADPTIHISVRVDDETEQVYIEIEDAGPGIPEQEFQAIQKESETQLSHASGIGLWLIHWMVDSLGGEVTIQATESEGSVVTMIVPTESVPSESERRQPTSASESP